MVWHGHATAHHLGARVGQVTPTAVIYGWGGGRYVLVASDGGA
jgi:hypothetical protein